MSDETAIDPNLAHRSGVRAVLGLGPLALGVVVAALLLYVGFGGSKTRFDEFALGAATTPVFARVEDQPIHCMGVEDAEGCVVGALERDMPATVLWLGNSQLHGVNQLEVGQEPAPAILFRRLKSQGLDLVTFSQPNANLQEHYILFEYLKARLAPRVLVLAVVFDDLRETGLRPDVALALRDPPTIAALRGTGIGRTILANNDDQQTVDPDLAGVQQTLQEHSERALNKWLDRSFPLWELRPEARGRIVTGLYNARNTVFGITAQTKRRVIPGRYDANMDAIRALLGSAASSGIRALVYVVPLRDDVEIPYEIEDYQRFKKELEQISLEQGAEFADLEDIVPASFWGQKDSTTVTGGLEMDFMHFQAAGHERLADAVGELIESQPASDPT